MDMYTDTHTYIFKDAHLWLGINIVLRLNQPQTQVKVNISNYDHSRNLCTSPLSTEHSFLLVYDAFVSLTETNLSF